MATEADILCGEINLRVVGPYETLSPAEQQMIDEGDTEEDILAARVRRFHEALSPQFCITVRVIMPTRSNYETIIRHAEHYMTEEEVFNLVDSYKRFCENQLLNREHRQKKMEKVRCPESISHSYKQLITKSRRQVNMLRSLSSYRGNPFMRALEQFGLYLFWRKPDAVELKQVELEAERKEKEEDELD